MKHRKQWTDEELASDWIRRYSSTRRHIVSLGKEDEELAASRRLDAETEWAFDVFHELESQDPEHTWELILLILRLAPADEGVRDNLAAGPLEGLLVHHGTVVIERIEEEARRNPRFKDLLDGVWKRSMPDHLWERVQRAIVE